MVSSQDQLKVILEILGKQDQEDLSFITDPSAVEYIGKMQRNIPKIDFEKEFQFTDSKILKILEKMLEFNPFFRKESADLLKNNVFDKIRIPKNEKPASEQIIMEIDK